MKYCAYCGASVADDARYCSNCGAALTDELSSSLSEPADRNVGYRIILVSRGTCSNKQAREVLCDLLGYNTATAKDLLNNVPLEIADELTELQAVTIAQALCEYGMNVTIVDEDDRYVNMNDKATSSIFDNTGALIASAAAALATLNAANRVHRYRLYKRPGLRNLFFRPAYPRHDVVHVRRNVVPEPEPRRRYQVQKPYSVSLPLHNEPGGGRRSMGSPIGTGRPGGFGVHRKAKKK